VPEPQNPYVVAGGQTLAPGRYEISLHAFVERFGWAASLYEIQD
jgi:hypothetical protein